MFKKIRILYLIITITIICFNIIILSYPNIIITSTRNSLLLWVNNVIPSLYPFIILNNILKEVNGFKILGYITKPITRILFKHNENGGVALVSGITSGYPLGGLVTADLLEKKLISLKEANFLIMFVNNAGPLFVIGTIGVIMFNSPNIGYFLLGNQIISSIVLGVILSFFKKNKSYNNKKEAFEKKNILDAISISVVNTNSTILLIGGFIIFYGIIISILNTLGIVDILISILITITPLNKYQSYALICGFFEMTTGISYLSKNITNLQIDLTIISAILAFGGLSIHGQTLTKVKKTKIKVKNYFIGKILHTLLAMIFTYTSYNLIDFLGYTPTFSGERIYFYYTNYYTYFIISLLLISLRYIFRLKNYRIKYARNIG